MTEDSKPRTINIVTAALGGEGGGVFTNWLIDVAESSGWLSQTTSLAGVAQRTGATIYYIELFPRNQAGSAMPVMSLFPAQGDIDLAISFEIAEAGRMLQRGFVTPDRTALISSTHRVYGITEKSDLGDGMMDPATVARLAAKYSKSFIRYDMLALAKKHSSVISSTMLGAVAGSGSLPFAKENFERAIRDTGKAVGTNLAAFEASYREAVTKSAHTGGSELKDSPKSVEHFEPSRDSSQQETPFSLPPGTTAKGRALLERLASEFPADIHEIACHGLVKTLDYQDYEYGGQYLDELTRFVPLDKGANNHELLQTVARYLALWMCFEDIPRVAQLKIRACRMDEIREEVQAAPGQILYVTEFFKPRAEEMCAILPAGVGNMMLKNRFWHSFLNLFAGGKKLKTNTLAIYFALRFLAFLRKFRRSALGYKHEYSMISAWLNATESTARQNMDAALELARCGRMVKGYGKTRERTTTQLMAIINQVEGQLADSSLIKELQTAALSGDDNRAFEAILARSA